MNHEITSFDHETIDKVYAALKDIGLSDKQSEEAIHQMQNRGIFFRERYSGDAQKARAAHELLKG